MTDEAARRAEEDPIKTAAQCLANKIMALREQRCDTHRHYLCDLCGERWIEEFTSAAVAQAVREEVEGLRKLAALDAETMERYAAEVEGLQTATYRYQQDRLEWDHQFETLTAEIERLRALLLTTHPDAHGHEDWLHCAVCAALAADVRRDG